MFSLSKVSAYLGKIFRFDADYFIKNGLWLTASQGIVLLKSFVLSILFANILSPQIFGQYKFVMAVLAAVSVFSLQSMYEAIISAVAKGYEKTILEAVKTVFKWSFFGSLILLCVAGYGVFSGRLLGVTVFLGLAVLYPIYSICGYYKPLLSGRKDFPRIAIFTIIFELISLVLLFIAIFFSGNVALIVWTTLLVSIIVNGSITFHYLKKRTLRGSVNTKAISYGKKTSLMQGFSSLSAQFDILIMPFFLGFEEIAVFAIAMLLPNQLKTITNTFVPLLLPKIAEKKKFDRTSFGKQVLTVFLLSLVLTIGYIVLSPFLFKYFYPQYLDYLNLSILYSFSFLTFCSILYFSKLIADEKTIEVSISRGISAASLIIGAFILIPMFGLLGAIINRMVQRVVLFICVKYFYNTTVV